MSTQRHDRVQEALRQEISTIIQKEIRDPRIGFLTITRVELTKDLRYAKVYFTILGETKDKHLALKGLNSAKGYIKGVIAEKIKLRYTPEISFKIDESLDHTRQVLDILERLRKERSDAGDNQGDKEI